MERNITVTLEQARKWYNSNNEALKEIALQTFSKEELAAFDFTKIKTFEDACKVLHYVVRNSTIESIAGISKASAAMFKLNIIRKALNLGQDLHLTEDPEDSYIYYPYNSFVTKNSICYRSELNSGKMEVIGKIKNEGKEYNVLGGGAHTSADVGLGSFYPNFGIGYAEASIGLLGCASKEIAEHFGKYFGMLITEAKYGDLPDFEIISVY